tara:strand:+ start:235 stop:1155 length:921 start_codon:yes stop_codon:yes gene_type:complete
MISKDTINIAIKTLNDLGVNVSFGKHVNECVDDFFSSSVKSRLEDLHDAFKDENVRGILTVIGGFNSNQLLSHIDYDLIKSNPKILCGYSDITALQNAIFAKTGVVTYSGPHFSSFGMVKGNEYTIEYFKKAVFESSSFEIASSKEWSDDVWFLDQENRMMIKNEGGKVARAGQARGVIVGGNLSTFHLLKGTPFMPSLDNTILFLEDDNVVDDLTPVEFDRNLQSILHLPEFIGVRGLVLGRFPKSCNMTDETIRKILLSKEELENIPIIFNLDFSHTTPMFTYPIGGEANIIVDKKGYTLKITS